MREQEADALRGRVRIGHGEQRVGAGGAGEHQDAVEVRVLVRLGERAHVGWVHREAAACKGFGHFVRLDHADDLDEHSGLLYRMVNSAGLQA
ncbi:Peptidase M23B [Alicycliphilus sp. B1]|nr:Peptidase M23B [Alicycliphilus sp. B1]